VFWKLPVELWFTAFMVAVLFGFSLSFGLPVRLPTSGGAALVGIHYLLPLIALLGLSAGAAIFSKSSNTGTILVALPCYAIVLIAHFNIKLWAPHINPATFDDAYWATDQALRPLVDSCMALRHALEPAIPYTANLYMGGFIALFYASFCYHAVRTPEIFRTLCLAAILFQGLGALSYLAFPALGPFIFERGLDPQITEVQHFMLTVHRHSVEGGPAWLSANGSEQLMMGLGAMPSLHAGGAFLFLWYALHYARALLPFYVPMFLFILITAVASRWHYLIDLPAGILLAWFSIRLAGFCLSKEAARATNYQLGDVSPQPC